MKIRSLSVFLLSACCFTGLVSVVHPATQNPALMKAQKDAEAKGYIFETSRDEIVARAKKEGKLRVVSTLEPAVIKAMKDGFRKKYPFITELRVDEIGSIDENQRLLLEVKAGAAKGWDVNRLFTDIYEEFLPYQKKFDILGMAQQKVLDIPPALVDPRTRNVVITSTNVNIIAYNKNLIPADKVPGAWEDFLKPEFKGKKFIMDVRPLPLAILVPAWGLEKTLDYARKLSGQEPIWGRGHSRIIASVVAGEYALFLGTNLGAVKRAQDKDPTAVLGSKLIEPVPIRLHEGYGILNTADYPYIGLLWLEFHASPEGQRIMDEHWPLGASVFSPGSAQEGLTRGKKLSVVDWSNHGRVDDDMKKIVEALGFPKAK
jgi:ABC-type Fe3+ transport system substrate-binding protein